MKIQTLFSFLVLSLEAAAAAERPHIVLFGLQDLFASFAALTGTELAKGSASDSHDMLAAVTSAGGGRRELLIQRQGGSGTFALRDGAWKLVTQPGKPPELFDLAIDPGERTNMAERQPTRVAAMRERLVNLVGLERMNPAPAQEKGSAAGNEAAAIAR